MGTPKRTAEQKAVLESTRKLAPVKQRRLDTEGSADAEPHPELESGAVDAASGDVAPSHTGHAIAGA